MHRSIDELRNLHFLVRSAPRELLLLALLLIVLAGGAVAERVALLACAVALAVVLQAVALGAVALELGSFLGLPAALGVEAGEALAFVGAG